MNETTGADMSKPSDTVLAGSKKEQSLGRRTQGNASTVAVTTGFCLPSIATASADFGDCRTKTQGCNSSALCCRGLTCQGGTCQAVCQGAGIQCSADEPCCSKQCVICTSACQGRCGLGKALSKDDIQVITHKHSAAHIKFVVTDPLTVQQIFYYPWYASVPEDGFWRHWAIDARPDGGVYDPSHQDIPANYYPRLGPYSSRALDVINMHMRWIVRAGIGTVVVSWWGKGSYEDDLLPKILNIADDWGLKVALYIEAYGGGYVRTNPSTGQTVGSRTAQTAMDDVKYLINRYGCHRAIYRREGRPVFMFFAARSYKDGDQTEWKQVWDKLHSDPNYNPVVIAHDTNLGVRIIAGGWDGGHDYGTNAAYTRSSDWKTLAMAYAVAGKTFYFTVSPGYDKTRLRGNKDAPIDRQDGQLYKKFWMRAIAAKTNKNPVVITSFNEVSDAECPRRWMLNTQHLSNTRSFLVVARGNTDRTYKAHELWLVQLLGRDSRRLYLRGL